MHLQSSTCHAQLTEKPGFTAGILNLNTSNFLQWKDCRKKITCICRRTLAKNCIGSNCWLYCKTFPLKQRAQTSEKLVWALKNNSEIVSHRSVLFVSETQFPLFVQVKTLQWHSYWSQQWNQIHKWSGVVCLMNRFNQQLEMTFRLSVARNIRAVENRALLFTKYVWVTDWFVKF